MGQYNFNNKQKKILLFLYSFATVLFFMLSGAIIHNSWKYLYRAKLGSTLVILFYVLAGIVAVSHTIMYFILAINQEGSPFLFDGGKFSATEFFEFLGSNTMIAIGWLVATTMFQLNVTVRLIFNLITPEKAVKQKRASNIFAVATISVEFTFIGLIPLIFSPEITS